MFFSPFDTIECIMYNVVGYNRFKRVLYAPLINANMYQACGMEWRNKPRWNKPVPASGLWNSMSTVDYEHRGKLAVTFIECGF